MRLSDYKSLEIMGNYETLEHPVYITSMEEIVNKAGKPQLNLTVKYGTGTQKVSVFDMSLQIMKEDYPFTVPGTVVVMKITKKDPFFNAQNHFKKTKDEFDLTEIAEKATDKDPIEFYNYILS